MARRDVAIVGAAQRPNQVGTVLTSVELILPVINEVIEKVGIDRKEIGFWCHGSCDYMSGQPFSFVAAVDAIGAWPPIIESHVEGDGALALYEAWVKIQTGECDVALVFSNGKTTSGPIDRILNLQADPYMVTPLWPGFDALAALQARACLDAGVVTELDMAEVAARSYRDALTNPVAYAKENVTATELLNRPYTTAPLRAHDCGVPVDGANAVILAAGDVARRLAERPAWIRGIDHRIDTQRLGARSMTESHSAAVAAEKAGVGNDRIDVAEIHAPYSHQELLLRRAMRLTDATHVNPSGGALVSNPAMAAGLARFVEAAESVFSGSADRVLAHCTSGPLIQQNLVCVMEGE
ncbi:MAG: thiolase domain-containing protein [Actinomycetota bacterium]